MNCGLFEPLIMFFGLCNSPATFQTMMNDILRPFVDCNEAICYMDDILIHSTSLTDHRRITWEILQTCQGASKTRSVHNVRVPAELRHIYEGSLKGNKSLLNA